MFVVFTIQLLKSRLHCYSWILCNDQLSWLYMVNHTRKKKLGKFWSRHLQTWKKHNRANVPCLLFSLGSSCYPCFQIFPGLILSDIKPAKRMKFKTVCYLLVQLMHCRKMFKAEIPFSNVMTCEDDDKVCVRNRSLFKKEKKLACGHLQLPCFA